MPAFAVELAGTIEPLNGTAHDDHATQAGSWNLQTSALEEVAIGANLGRVSRRHLFRNNAGFLEASVEHAEESLILSPTSADAVKRPRQFVPAELPTSLLQSAALGTDLLKDPSAEQVGKAELAFGTALAVPLMKKHVPSGRNAVQRFTEFFEWGHDHYLGQEWDPELHDYAVDIRPLSARQIFRMVFAAITNVMEHALGPHFMVHALVLLALAAIWAPYDKIAMAAVKGVPKLVGGVIAGIGVVATGLYKAGKAAVEMAGRAIVAGAKLVKSFAVGAFKLGKAAVKVIGKGFEILGVGLFKAGKLMWKGMKAIGKGLGKFGVGLGMALGSFGNFMKDAAENIAKAGRKFGNWLGGIEIGGISLKKFGKFVGKAFKGAWKGVKFLAKGLWKGAKLVGKGLVNLYKVIDSMVKLTGHAILAAGEFLGGITGEQLGAGLLIAGALGAGALLLMHNMRKRKGRNTMTWATKKKGRAGRKINPMDAREAALKAAAEREAQRKKQREGNQGSLTDAPIEPKRQRWLGSLPQKRRKKKQGMSLEDLMEQQRNDINAAHMHGQHVNGMTETGGTPLGGRGFAAAAAAGGAVVLANSMSGSSHKGSNRGATVGGHEFAAGDLSQGPQVQPGPVVIGSRKHGMPKPHGALPGDEVDIKPHSPSPRPIPALPRQHELKGNGETGENDDTNMIITDSQEKGNSETGENSQELAKDETTKGSEEEARNEAAGTTTPKNKQVAVDNVEDSEDLENAEKLAERTELKKHREQENRRADRELIHLGMQHGQAHRNRAKDSWKQKSHDWDNERVWSNPTGKTAPGVRHARTYPQQESNQFHLNRSREQIGMEDPATDRNESIGAALGGKAARLENASNGNQRLVERANLEAEQDSRVKAAVLKSQRDQLEKTRLEEEVGGQSKVPPSRSTAAPEILPSVASAYREHRANTFDLKTVQRMDDDEFTDFKVNVERNNDFNVERRHAGQQNNVRRVSSSLAFAAPRHSSERASAFLGISQDDVLAPCNTQRGLDFGDADFSPLYYIDQDGHPRDFLDPAKLKHELRKLAITSGLAGSSFLEVPITEQKLRSS